MGKNSKEIWHPRREIRYLEETGSSVAHRTSFARILFGRNTPTHEWWLTLDNGENLMLKGGCKSDMKPIHSIFIKFCTPGLVLFL